MKDSISVEQTLEIQLENARLEAGLSLREFHEMPGSHIWLGKKYHLCLADILIAYQIRHGQTAIIETIQSEKMKSKK